MAVKIKKKKWYQILAPNMFRNQVIGESLVTEGSLLLGRCISANLMALTNDMKKQNINVQFYINEIHNNQAKTVIKAYDLIPASIKRLVRRNKNKIDDSFLVKTSDNVSVRIKPLLTTRSRCSRPVMTDVRKAAKEQIIEYASKVDYTNFFNDIVFNKLQKSIKQALNKIYPLKIIEIRSVKLVASGSEVKDSEIKYEPRKVEEASSEKPQRAKPAKKLEVSEEQGSESEDSAAETEASEETEEETEA